jgi:hypothetical protein
MKKRIQIAIVFILVGVFCIYWAQTHSPKAGIGQIVGNKLAGSYTISEPWYYSTLAVGAILAIVGIMKFIKK